MATYGARYSRWAPFAPEAQDNDKQKLPQYGKVEDLGQLNKVTDEMTFVEGSMPGDDQIVLYEKKFSTGKVDIESVFLPIKTAAAMLGAAVDEADGLAYGDDDEAPYGGYGFITHHLGKGKHYYQVVFYPMVQATPPATETYTTRGENLTFATDKLSLKVLLPFCRKYKIPKDFATEAEASAYLDGLFAGTSPVPGLNGVAAAAQVKKPPQQDQEPTPEKGK